MTDERPIIILISGKQGSGKTTIADELEGLLWQTHTPIRKKFAGPLYEMHDAALEVLRDYGIAVPEVDADMLQLLGTEIVRNKYGKDTWVSCLRNSILKDSRLVYIIDDARFPNEIDGLDDLASRVLKVRLECPEETRKARRGSKWRENTNHESEVALDDYEGWNAIYGSGVYRPEVIARSIQCLLSGANPQPQVTCETNVGSGLGVDREMA